MHRPAFRTNHACLARLIIQQSIYNVASSVITRLLHQNLRRRDATFFGDKSTLASNARNSESLHQASSSFGVKCCEWLHAAAVTG